MRFVSGSGERASRGAETAAASGCGARAWCGVRSGLSPARGVAVPLSSDRGAGTVLAVLIVAVVVVVGLLVMAVCGALAAQRRAGVAADLAALAAADIAIGRLPGEPCEVARNIARANGAVVSACAVTEAVAVVTVQVGYAGLVASASARAGPAGTP
ncbi:Rv3654c family TadE-like protein [Leifsonia xyli]|uniref:Rv3654c family TadE-like protein n=1 Tax=Leifsonia xyli TaxID=1575 RepID=UPI0009DB8D7A